MADLPTVTVYSTPSCVQCKGTYRKLDQHGVTYEVVDLSTNAEAMAAIKEMDYSQAPVVVVREPGATEDTRWQGYRPDLIEKHITAHLTQKETISA